VSHDYPARQAYRDETEAASYERIRFSHLRGKIGHWLDIRAIRRTMRDLRKNYPVLDLACGTGRITRFLAAEGFAVVGVDMSEQMLREAQVYARKKGGHLDLCEADGARLPFGDGTYGCVTAVRFWGHLPAHVRPQVLAEMNRVTERYAMLEICLQTPLASARRRLQQWKEPLPPDKTWDWHVFTTQEAEREFAGAGFRTARRIPKLPGLSDAWYFLLEKA